MNRNRRITFALAAAVIAASQFAAPAQAALAELRSSAAVLPAVPAGQALPTAPGGAVSTGALPWVCDAGQGLAPVVSADNDPDPLLALGTVGSLRLPLSAATTAATCGQIALDALGNAYITQAVVDTRVTPSVARGILRVPMGAAGPALPLITPIATTAGLDGNQPTGAAVGPDGNLYVVFLKNGNVKRVIAPGTGTTQVVQSVGNTPSGHPGRALAFVGNDLFIASVDALSVILNATNPVCQGGCNAVPISDGFGGIPHTALAYDGALGLYFEVAGNPLSPGSSQVWRLNLATGLYTFVAQGGADRTGANASNFAFVAAKTNLLAVDQAGTLWIGDDTSNGTAAGAGRLWTMSAAELAGLPGAQSTAGTNLPAIFATLHGPWFTTLRNFNTGVTTQLLATFNLDGTFTAQITQNLVITSDAGTWTLTPPNVLQPVANPQGHLTLTNSQGVVLFSNDILLFNVDQFISNTQGTGTLGAPFQAVWTKFAP